MFLENKYTKIYWSLIENSKNREKPLIIERHHIIPKCLGGTNDCSNISILTPREHFIAHVLLTKMVIDLEHKKKMCYALLKMGQSNGYPRIGNGRLYERIKKSLVEYYSGKNAPGYGYRHTDKAKKEISLANKNKKLSDKHKNTLRLLQLGRKQTEEFIEKRKKKVKYIIIFPNGKVEEIINMKKFCKEYNLNRGHMCSVAKGKRKCHKGFKAKRIN